MLDLLHAWRTLALAAVLACTAASAVAASTAEAAALGKQVEKLYEKGRYADAIPLARKALSITQKALGPDHPGTTRHLIDLASLCEATEAYDEAERLYQRALRIRQQALRPEHPDTAEALHNLASLYDTIGAYDKAIPLYKRALEIREKALGREHEDTADSLNGLALLHYHMGAYDKAEPLFQRALKIVTRTKGKEHPDTATSLNNLAGLYDAMGDHAQAEPLYQRALEIDEKALGPDHPDTAAQLNNLGTLYLTVGAYDRAELLLRRALAIREKTLGPAHSDTAASLINLAKLHAEKGDLEEAKRLYVRALEIQRKALGSQHPDIASGLSNLAALLYSAGAYDEAGPLLRRALEIREKALGPAHPDVALSLNDLATVSVTTGDFAQAESQFQRALVIQEKLLGPQHPEVATILNNLALTYWSQEDLARALPPSTRAREIEERNIGRLIRAGTEERRRQYLGTLRHDFNVTYSLASQAPGARELGAAAVLQLKGRVLDATADAQARLRQHLDEPGRALLTQLQQVVARRSELSLAGPAASNNEAWKQRLGALAKEQDRLEADLAGRSAEFQKELQPVTLRRVQAELGALDVLIEWTRFEPYMPKGKGGRDEWGTPRYAAYLITRDLVPSVVDLGPAEDIEQAVQRLQRQLLNKQGDPRSIEARALYNLAMQPLLVQLAKLQLQPEQVLLSPDGALNLVPLAALVDEQNRFLAERYTLSYLSSGRDLLRLKDATGPRSGVMVMANPAFDQPGRVPAAGAGGAEASDTTGRTTVAGQRAAAMDRSGSLMSFLPLSGTDREAKLLKEIYNLPANQVATGEAATETRLKSVAGPAILHMATHGFFMQDLPRSGAKASAQPGVRAMTRGLSASTAQVAGGRRNARGVVEGDVGAQLPKLRQGLGENPLLRSGLALAGANLRRSEGGEDGILTAAEVAQLDLQGTQLVVLSACETGTGDVANGEGVYGLRRALVLAGAQSQLVSLWKVDDDATAQLMGDYYRRLKQGEGRAQALRSAQATLRADPATAHPYYWAPFIPVGDWRPLKLETDAIATR